MKLSIKKVILISGIVFGLFFCMLVAGAASGLNRTASMTDVFPTESSTPLPTDTPKPTSTLRPTNTSVPIPTKTKVIVEPPRIDAEILYRTCMVDNLSVYHKAMDALSILMKAVGNDPYLLFDQKWLDDLTFVESVVVNQSYLMANCTPVPSRFQGMDALAEDLYSETVKMVDNLNNGIAYSDVDKLSAALDNLDNINRILKNMLHEIDQINQEADG